MMFSFIAKHRGIWPVALTCEALGVSRSGFYAWLRREPSERARRDEVLTREVRRSFLDSDRTYGARRVWHDVLAAGLCCGLHAIERLMRLNALKARPRRRRSPADSGERPAAGAARQHPRPAVRCTGAEPQMGGGLHLRLDGRGLALRGGRARPLLAPHRRLVDECGDDGRARHRCARHGDLAARTTKGAAASLRPRQPVHERAVPTAAGRARGRLQPVALGQRLGQRSDGKLLLLAQDRAHGRQGLPFEGPSQGRHLRLHRTLL